MPKQMALAAVALMLTTTLMGTVAEARSAVVVRGQTQCRQVALTFDGGATAVAARGILAALGAHRARSTFFPTGQFVDDFPALAADITARGHEVGNHTNTHPDMPTIPVEQMRRELRITEAVITDQMSRSPRPYWRPPYGSYNNQVLDVAEEEGYPWTLMWDVDTIDWEHPSASVIVNRVLSSVQPGSIVLMHMGGENTDEAVAAMLPDLERRGFQMVTIGEILGHTRSGADFGGRVVYVQPGDTLTRIAGCFNTTVPVLAAANAISDPNRIDAGQRLYVPLRDEVTVRVNGQKLNLAVPSRAIDGRTLVHVRAVAEAFGAAVHWNGATQEITINRGGTNVRLTIGNTTAFVNGQPVTLDVPPYIIDNRTQVPLRFVAEVLGATIEWDAASRTANVTD